MLTGIRDIELNVETDGLQWFAGHRPIAISIALPGGRTQYIPWGHRGGGNLDEVRCKEWAKRELRGKRITNINTRFDIHMLREWGVDLEAQGNEVSDVGHTAALLDDHRFKTGLDTLIPEFLDEPIMPRLDESRMVEYHAGEAAPRSEYNVLSVQRLRQAMAPMIAEQDLQKIHALEDRVIYPVCEMEKNGVRIDQELLNRWVKESEQELLRCLWKLHRETGLKVEPTKDKSLAQLFQKLKLPIIRTSKGNPSFTADILKAHKHPIVDLVRRARKLASLRSKYLLAYQQRIGSDGILRYGLHQLRSVKDDAADAGEAGTISGRFSSTEIAKGVGVNIQQVMKTAKQRVSFGYDEDDSSHDEEIFIIRRLMLPEPGKKWLSADAMQIEYRIFASYANNPKVIQAYRDNPEMSFHKFMHELLRPFATLTYRQQKDLNFAYVYGAGMTKMSLMLGHITQAEFEDIRKFKQYDHPKLAATKEVRAIYDREVPEVKLLLARAAHIAKPECDSDCDRRDRLHQTEKHRGFVKTVLGRRSRFPDGQRLHKAFNAVDQGSAADIAKEKTVELHESRKDTGFVMRYVVHDEVDGDSPDDECTRKVGEILNRQSVPMRVPILWEVATGANWMECG